MGARHRRRVPDRVERRPSLAPARRGREFGSWRAHALSGARDLTGRRRSVPRRSGAALAERPAAQLAACTARATTPTRASPSGQPAMSRISPSARAGRRATRRVHRARRATAGAVHLLADRAGPRAARPRDRRASCASCTRTSRSTGWPRTRSRALLEAEGERIHPASAHLANESRHIESESAEHDLHCFQALRGGWTRSCHQLHGLPRRRRARAATTCGSPTRPGSSTTTCTRTRSSKRAAYAWLTDFVGWLPMPDGGEREAVPDRRLQRRDGRAHRAPSAAARPRDLRRATPTTSSRPARARAPADPRLDRATTSTSPAM